MNEVHSFGTDLSSRILLGIVFGFFVVIGIAGALDGAYVLGPFLAFAGLGAWLHWASLRVIVSARQVIVSRYGITIFSAPRDNVRATFGRGGELRTHTALLLEATGQKRVELLRSMFGPNSLSELARLLGLTEEIAGGAL